MEWAEIGVRTSHEAMELVASILEDLGAAGVAIEDPALVNAYIHSGLWDYTDLPEEKDTAVVTVKAYFPADDRLPFVRRALTEKMTALAARGVDTAPAAVREARIADEDWAESWKQYFHTEKVGTRIVIQPSWESYDAKAGEIVLRLDPGAAFGTGTHPTTALCLRAMERILRPGMSVFDVGTGSGVLAIAAAKLGAGNVMAVDYDPTALHVARENIARNDLMMAIALGESDMLKQVSGRADLITANIIADIILRLFEDLEDHLNVGGTLLASGIIVQRADDVRRGALSHGFTVAEEWEEKGWVAMVIRREGEG